ncbi:hypothetical protein KHP62_10655 [Rhodobacteraceae bacterium NNCM2]|nr:hypothetical protein [Coraliihabitans acroporae]
MLSKSCFSQAITTTAIVGLGFASPGNCAEDWGPIQRDESVREVPYDLDLYSADPTYTITYDPQAEIDIYGGKSAISTPRPPLEMFRNMYDAGPLGDGFTILGEKNRVFPQLMIFGDLRTAVAYNDNGGKEVAQVAARANINVDFKITATERIQVLFQPLQDGASFTRYEFGGPDADHEFTFENQGQPTTAFLEGDLGAIFAGITDEYNSYDIPFAAGLVPLFLQNGVWFDEAFLGFAVTPLVAQNSATLDITNYDITFFAGFDEVTTPALVDANGNLVEHDANIYGVAGFFDTYEGYLEAGYAYLDDRDKANGDFSYHNFTLAFTKRYAATVSNSTRIIANVGQNPGFGLEDTANGVLFISENAFITSLPLTLIPYANFWFGVDSTQSAARAAAAGGILRNIGINFETDGLTGFPTLDATGIDTYGGAIGIEYLFSLEQQIVAEFATVIPYDDRQGPAKDPQFALGLRYQRPLTNRLIFRADAMYGMLLEQPDIMGVRAELRFKL